jgi:hypothetical protein
MDARRWGTELELRGHIGDAAHCGRVHGEAIVSILGARRSKCTRFGLEALALLANTHMQPPKSCCFEAHKRAGLLLERGNSLIIEELPLSFRSSLYGTRHCVVELRHLI